MWWIRASPVEGLHESWDPRQTIQIPMLLCFKRCRTIPYLNTFPNYTLSQYFAELYPISIQNRNKFLLSIKWQQYPQAAYLGGAVLFKRAGGGGGKKSVQIFFFRKSLTLSKMSLLPILLQCRTHSARAQKQLIYCSESESSTKNHQISSANQNLARKNPQTSSANQNRVLVYLSRQLVRIGFYVTRELSARVEDPPRLSALVGSL